MKTLFQMVTRCCHVRYDQLWKKLPSATIALRYFQRFVEAMDDMYGVLGRHASADRAILKIGRFQRARKLPIGQ